MICPHCQGTGYKSRDMQPIQMFNGIRLRPSYGVILAALIDAKGRALKVEYLSDLLQSNPGSVRTAMHFLNTITGGIIQNKTRVGYYIDPKAVNLTIDQGFCISSRNAPLERNPSRNAPERRETAFCD